MALFTKTVLRPLERDLAEFVQPYMVPLDHLDKMDVQEQEEEEETIPNHVEKEPTKVAKPLDVVAVTSPPNTIKAKRGERQRQLIKLVLKLASISGYNEEGRLRLKDGTFSEELNVVPFLSLALRKGRNVKGIEDFVCLLREAKITPDMVVNEYLKQMLEETTVESPTTTTSVEVEPSEQSPMESVENNEAVVPTRGIKRKIADANLDGPHAKRQKVMKNVKIEEETTLHDLLKGLKLKKKRGKREFRRIKYKPWISVSSSDEDVY